MDNNFLGKIINGGKKILKAASKVIVHTMAPIIAIFLIIIIILSGLDYENTMQQGTEREGDWTSTPYVANQFDADIEIAEDGTITSSITPKELWDEMIKRGNEIKSYLDTPTEFAKLLQAEQITNFPDTRPDPSEEINWDEIIKPNSNRIQGIIKFKRETGGADPIDLIYVDDGTFMDWLEGYNLTGDESLRENLLTHFTIGSNTVQTQNNNQDVSLNYQEGDVWTDISEAIVRAAISTGSRGGGLCQSWVYHVYVNAGLPAVGADGAYQRFLESRVSTDRNNIPIGACVYSTGSKYLSNGNDNIYGHVGIYVGDIDNDGVGEVKDDIGYVRTIDLSEWIAEAEREGNTSCGGTPGYLGWGWQSGAPTRFLTEEEIEEIDITSEATEPVEGKTGDGNTSSKTSYYAIVATWNETTESTTVTVDGNVTSSSGNSYGTMTTQNINYQDYISQYTMPYDYLWALILTGDDKNLALDLVDLVLDSQIEITVHDTLTTTTDRVTTVMNYEEYNPSTGQRVSHTSTTVDATVVETNTLNIGLTKADVWIVDYSQEYKYTAPTIITETSDTVATNNGTKTYYNLITADKYLASPAKPEPKIKKGKDQHNFITIFTDQDNYHARNSILSAPDWLFNILERNDSTKEMVDLTKYLLYVATGNNYGVTDYDFSVFEPGDFNSVSIGIYGGTVEEKIWFALRDAGFSEIAAAGALGNIYQESRFNYESVETGYDEYVGGIGLCGWTNYPRDSGQGRNQQLRDYASSKGTEWRDLNTQIEFLISELTPGGAGPAQGYANYCLTSYNGYNADMWINATTPEDAAIAFCWTFERPGIPRMEVRTQKAREYYEEFKGKTKPSGAGSIISACNEVTQEFLSRNAIYSVDGSKLISGDIERCWTDSQYICCATYVSLVLYRSGVLTPEQINPYAYHAVSGIGNMLRDAGWKQVSASEAQPGDVVEDIKSHAMIYAGDGRVWDQTSCVISSYGDPPTRSTAPYNLAGCRIWRAP